MYFEFLSYALPSEKIPTSFRAYRNTETRLKHCFFQKFCQKLFCKFNNYCYMLSTLSGPVTRGTSHGRCIFQRKFTAFSRSFLDLIIFKFSTWFWFRIVQFNAWSLLGVCLNCFQSGKGINIRFESWKVLRKLQEITRLRDYKFWEKYIKYIYIYIHCFGSINYVSSN